MTGVLDRIEQERDESDIENKADQIIKSMATDRKKNENHRRETGDRMERIEKTQRLILVLLVGGAVLSLISAISSIVIILGK